MKLLTTKEIDSLFEAFSKNDSNPAIELNYTSPFTLLIAIVLSAQSTDKMVNKITHTLFEIAKTPEKMIALGEENLKKYVKSINYFNNKSKYIIKISEELIAKHNSCVPDSFDELVALPGVGRKSANVLLNSLHKQPTIAVDTHVFRVSNRIGLCDEKSPAAVEKALEKVIPNKWKENAHHWLVLHGRYVCKARKPLCESCILKNLCKYYNDKK